MQIRIENTPAGETSVDTGSWREAVEARVRFVMRRLQLQVTHVHVRLVDVNGPRGGVDQRCQVTVASGGRSLVVARATQARAALALDAALKRATTALVRLWQKQRAPGRQKHRATRRLSIRKTLLGASLGSGAEAA